MSVEKKTVLFIKVREDEFHRLNFLTKYPGFNKADSHPNDLQSYREYVAYYDLHITSSDRRELTKTIEEMGGHVRIRLLGKGPLLSEDMKKMLIHSFLMSIVAFFSGFSGVHFLSPLPQVQVALSVGGITAAATFFMELAYGYRAHHNKD